MLGIWVNFLAVLIGGGIGTLLKGGIPDKYRTTLNAALALCVMVIGISGAIGTANMLIVIISLVIGSALGELIGIERGIERLGNWAQARFSKGGGGFADGFVNTTLLVSVGAMAVVGSLDAGLANNPDTLLAKSALDFVSAMIFGSSMGLGVVFAAVPMTIYQGAIALGAGALSGYLTDPLIAEMSAVGSVLIIALSINMLGLTKQRLKVANMLPAMFVPCLYFPIAEWLAKFF